RGLHFRHRPFLKGARAAMTATKGIVRLDVAAVDALFEQSTHQADVLVGLYRMVFPEWDAIAALDRWPQVNGKTWGEICRRFFAFDQKHHPGVLAGGLWLNSGFSGPDEAGLPDWAVDTSPCAITLRKETA